MGVAINVYQSLLFAKVGPLPTLRPGGWVGRVGGKTTLYNQELGMGSWYNLINSTQESTAQ